MRVAIVGAGTLGWAYGSRLAMLASCEVTLVAAQAKPPRLVRLERVDSADVLEWTSPAVLEIPPVDVIVSCVRYEDLDKAMERMGGASAPVVMLTPMMPQDYGRLSTRLGGRLIAAMPSVVAYWSTPGSIRYWIPRVATTLIEAQKPRGVDAEFVARLERAGIASKLDHNVFERNVATTVSILPLAFGLDIANGVDPLLQDRALLSLTLEAVDEGRDLGKRVGALTPWASAMTRFIGPFTLKAGLGIVRARAPEVIRFANEHFGRKLHTQNVSMAVAMLQLATEKGVKRSALQKLLDRLRAQSR